MKKVYLDYAATTPVKDEVLQAMAPYWTEKFGNPSSLHAFGREARLAVEEAREIIAKILNCEVEEVIFTGTTTTSDNLAILGTVENMINKGLSPHLITSQIEHHGVLDVFKHLEKKGYQVDYLPVDQYGSVRVEDLKKSLRPETALVSIMYANNEIGTIEPISDLVTEAKKGLATDQEIYFHTDAAAVAEYLPLDVKKLGVDLLTLGSHKFGGPKGVGILYIKKGTKLSPITFGGHHENGLWPGTESVPLIVGMTKALFLAQKQIKENSAKISGLQKKLIEGILEKIPGAILTGHPEQRLPDIVSFCFEGVEGEAVLLRLDYEGIAASSGSACTSGELKPSHVLLACGVKQEVAHGSIRFSLGSKTTEQEIDYVLEKLPKIVEDLRNLAPKL